MKRFYLPIITRSKHDEECRKLKREIDSLKKKLCHAQNQLEAFKAAQTGECVPSKRCTTCNHCLEIIEFCGIGRYTNTVCELNLPQCQQYQAK